MAWKHVLGDLAAAVGSNTDASDVEITGVCTDSRKVVPGSVFFALSGERFDAHDFVPDVLAQGAAAAVVNRPLDVDGPCIVVEDTLTALQQFAAWHRSQFNIPVIAITGSAGKTTTKDMVTAVLGSKYTVLSTQGNLNNEIGCPLTLLALDASHNFAVIEMGANHMGEIGRLCQLARPSESAITLIAPAHLEGFGSIDNVAVAKGEIADSLPESGTFYVNNGDPRCVAIGERCRARTVTFGPGGSVNLRAATRTGDGDLMLDIDPIGTITIPLASQAHSSNALLAIAIGLQHGITDFETPLRAAASSARRFKVSQIGHLTVLDDSYNANPASMKAALDTLGEYKDRRTFAALGDMLEMGPESSRYHGEIGSHAAACGVDTLIARGRYQHDTISGARTAGVPHVFALDDYDAIAGIVLAEPREGDVLLVKGSRGMAMENVITSIRTRLDS